MAQKLTPQEREEKNKIKVEALKLKAKKMLQKAKQIESSEKAKERKERTRELIEIGAIISQYHDRKKLLDWLRNSPQLAGIDLNNNTWNLPKTFKLGDVYSDKLGRIVVIKSLYIDLKQYQEDK